MKYSDLDWKFREDSSGVSKYVTEYKRTFIEVDEFGLVCVRGKEIGYNRELFYKIFDFSYTPEEDILEEIGIEIGK